MFLSTQISQEYIWRHLRFRNFYTIYCDSHRISRRSSIYILINFRKGDYLRNEIHLLVRRNENQISIKKMNGTTFPTLFCVKEFLNYQMYSKTINSSGKKLQLSEAQGRKTRSANMHTGQLFLFIFYFEKNPSGSPEKSVVSYISQTPLRLDENLCFSLRERNGLASVWESVNELLIFWYIWQVSLINP